MLLRTDSLDYTEGGNLTCFSLKIIKASSFWPLTLTESSTLIDLPINVIWATNIVY